MRGVSHKFAVHPDLSCSPTMSSMQGHTHESISNRKRADEKEPPRKQSCQELSTSADECDKCRDIRAILRIAGELTHDPGYFGLAFPKSKDAIGFRLANISQRFLGPGDTPCQLCLVLMKSRINIEVNSEQNCVKEDYELRALPFARVFGLARYIKAIQENSFSLFIGHRECFKAGPKVINRFILVAQNGVAVLSKPQGDPNLFSPRPVPKYYDHKLIRQWISYCQKHHLSCRRNSSTVKDLHLIDCKSRRIRPAVMRERYVALSYVWGKCDTQPHDGTQHAGDPTKLPDALPMVIEDAMSVTKKLGYNYLWVDKYCIDQNDRNIKHDQIRQMHLIYETAELTIVAACGLDQNDGLASVGTPRLATETTIRLGNASLSWVIDPQQSIRGSRWSTRGWTYQEAFLARRRLVFTKEQAYFECNVMSCCENLYIPLDTLHDKTKAEIKDIYRAGMFGAKLNIQDLSRWHLHLQYCVCVKEYSRRELTYDTDILNAFLGIIRIFESREAKETFDDLRVDSIVMQEIQGILHFPNYGRVSWNYFCHSLCWYHHKLVRAERRPQFPSWTWLGWSGEVRFPVARIEPWGDLKFSFGYEGLIFQNQSGTRWKTPPREDRRQSSNSTWLMLCLKANEVEGSYITYGQRPKAEPDTRPSWSLCGYDTELYLSETAISDLQLLGELRDGSTWRSIYLGHAGAEEECWVMLLKRMSSDTWSRAGLFQVYCPGDIFCVESGIKHQDKKAYKIS
ncbi:heterokaryon incompatibility protein-domain-containing protein [Xylaria curta]|nr:heterokaryon incompatibility protein-domain-containing protein [Xylaria curta]